MKTGKFLKYFILLVVAGNLALVAYVFLGAATPKPTPMPNPNGYDDFVKAGQMLAGDSSDFSGLDMNQLLVLTSKYDGSSKLVHSGLRKECRVPDNYSSNYATTLIPAVASFKHLALYLRAEGRLAELEGRTNDAAKIYLDGIRLGQESSRGGVMIHKLIDVACESIVLKPLQPLTQSLDAKQCSEIARVLEDIDAKAEPIEETMAYERNFAGQIGGIAGQFTELLRYKAARENRKKVLAKLNAGQIYRRSVMLAFAARAYELDKGHRPASVADLVPAYLKTIPQDPVTGTNLVYPP